MRMAYISMTHRPKSYSTEQYAHSVTDVSALRSRLTWQSTSCTEPPSGHGRLFLPLSSDKKRKPSGYRNRSLSTSSIGPPGSIGREQSNFATISTAMMRYLGHACL